MRFGLILWTRLYLYLLLIFKLIHRGIVRALLQRRNRPLPILTKPNWRLLRYAEPIGFEETPVQEIVDIIRKLNASLMAQNWGNRLGLAAPQIDINKRIFIYLSRGSYKVCINPIWRPSKAPQELIIEACYSLRKGDYYKVRRDSTGWAHYQGINGRWEEEKLNGQDAIVYQHELGHLDGICCDKIGELIKDKNEQNKSN